MKEGVMSPVPPTIVVNPQGDKAKEVPPPEPHKEPEPKKPEPSEEQKK
jgi:hypothetical protein